MRRLMLHLSQTDVANKLGLSFQQVEKYENGMNRIGASRLQHIARVSCLTARVESGDLLFA
jgi:transcriptional regulator with XRE-family HTH domain